MHWATRNFPLVSFYLTCLPLLFGLFLLFFTSSVDASESLWSASKLRSICKMNEEILRRHPKLVDADCISSSSSSSSISSASSSSSSLSGAVFSLPAVVMEISGARSCDAITRYHLVSSSFCLVYLTLSSCYGFFLH